MQATLKTADVLSMITSLEHLGNMSMPKGLTFSVNLCKLKHIKKQFSDEANLLMEQYGIWSELVGHYRSRTLGRIEPMGYDDVYISDNEKRKEYDKKLTDILDKEVEVDITTINLNDKVKIYKKSEKGSSEIEMTFGSALNDYFQIPGNILTSLYNTILLGDVV